LDLNKDGICKMQNGSLTIHIERDSHGPVRKFIPCCTEVDP